MAEDDGEAKVVRGASLLILLQIVSRAITFVANQVLVRFLTAQLLGISTQLEVYYLSILFLARESLRVAIQRQGTIAPSNPDHAEAKKKTEHGRQGLAEGAVETQAVVNLGYIAILLGLAAAGVLGRFYLGSLSAETVRTTPNLVPSVYIYALASLLELLSEPAFVVMQIRLQFAARATAEGAATSAKCAVTLASAVWASRRGLELGVLPFALGQTAYGLGLLGVYAWYGTALAGREGFSLVPRRLGGGGAAGGDYLVSLFYSPTVKLASSMMLQSFVKHLLTQGDTFLVSILSTPKAQGVYALANNYGGLLARLVLQPIEESSRSYWSRLLSGSDAQLASTTAAAKADGTRKPDSNDGNMAVSQQTAQPAALRQASDNLTSLLQGYILVALPLTALGPVAAPLALSIVAGPQWTSEGAGDALAAYVYYIPLLAVNGLTEAFVASVATEAQVHRQSVWMAGFSLVFAGAAYVLMRVLGWGAVGLVCANAINMACRIVWAACFIREYFAARGARWEVARVLPQAFAVLAAAAAAQIVRRVTGAADVGAGEIKAVIGELVKIAGVAVPLVGVLYVPTLVS